jgi:hypothetical protein
VLEKKGARTQSIEAGAVSSSPRFEAKPDPRQRAGKGVSVVLIDRRPSDTSMPQCMKALARGRA